MATKSGRTEFALSAVAFVAAAVPVWMLVFGGMATMKSMGMSMMDVMRTPPNPAMMPDMMKGLHSFFSGYIRFAMIPALILLGIIWAYSARHYPRLANRIAAGAAASFIASLGLDAVRLIGVKMGAFPGDMPTMFGQAITGDMSGMMSGVVAGKVRFVGYFYHLALNGTTFGIMYAILAGRARWIWGLAWGLFFELGMMTLPPVPMMAGPFGIFGFWPRLFVASLIAHIVYGVILGVLAYRWVREPGTIFSLWSEEPGRPELARVA